MYQLKLDCLQGELDAQLLPVKKLLGYIRQIVDDDLAQPHIYYEEAAVVSVREAILAEADEYENRNIKAYLDPDYCEEDEEDDDEQDEEDEDEEDQEEG